MQEAAHSSTAMTRLLGLVLALLALDHGNIGVGTLCGILLAAGCPVAPFSGALRNKLLFTNPAR
jgi:hypothetical protein